LVGHAERADSTAARVVAEGELSDQATRLSSRDDRVGQRRLVNDVLGVEHELSE
jgi:hypothetical protein